MANFENITIEKGMYQTKGGISGALEKLDPSENYRGTALEGLDAFSRQLKRFDIRVSGPGSDLVEKLNQFFVDSYADGSMMELAETYGVQAAVIPQE